MTVDIQIAPFNVRFEHLYNLISGQRFLRMEGLGNEVPFFICPYSPEEELDMQRLQRQLCNQLSQNGVTVLAVNLYDLVIELLEARDIWEQVLEIEATKSKDEFMELLQGVLDSEKYLIPAIAEKMRAADFDVLFLSGAGEVFPYIRSHNVLNNLQATANEHPTVLFFPGAYIHSLEQGASLDLFSRLHDDKYYRAFNIYHCQV